MWEKKLSLLSVSSGGWRRRRSWWFGEKGPTIPNQMSCPGLDQPRVFMVQGPAGARVAWCDPAQCSPAGALVQLGGVLALHVHHVVLRSLLQIEMEQLLGLPVTLDSSLLENLTGPTTLN